MDCTLGGKHLETRKELGAGWYDPLSGYIMTGVYFLRPQEVLYTEKWKAVSQSWKE